MDSGLLTRALVVGFVCFILAAGVFYYQSLMAEQSNRHYEEITGSMASNSNDIGAIGLMILIIIGFVIMSIAAGVATTLVSANQWDRPGNVIFASAIAGIMSVMLFWAVFWCLTIANVIGVVLGHEPFDSNDVVFFGYLLVTNILMVGMGAVIAGVSGFTTRTLARSIIGRSD